MKFDLIIIGGGLVGSGLAMALQTLPLQIALVDARLPSADDPRLFALNSGSCQFLRHLKLWDKLQAYACAIQQVHVSKRGRFGAVRLKSNKINNATLGHVIPAKYIEAALQEKISQNHQCKLYQPARLIGLQQEIDHVILEIDNGATLQLEAPIVIGADGSHSTVRQLLNAEEEIFAYGQSALVTRTTLRRSHQHIAYERFTDDGAIAMLPLKANECATIWTTSAAKVAALSSLTESLFLENLQKEFGYRLGRLLNIAERYTFPLQMRQAKNNLHGSVFLLGNAAHTLHPIAAQGFNLAIYEVATLVEGLKEKLNTQGNVTREDLQLISEQMRRQQKVSVGISHYMSQLFVDDAAILKRIVQLGMVGLDIFTPAKNKFIKEMMGQAGKIPRLLLSPMDYEEYCQ